VDSTFDEADMEYHPSNWFWIVAGSIRKVYSSKVSDYVDVGDPDYAAWLDAGGQPTMIDSEANLGAVLYPYRLKPISQGVLDGYTDAQVIDLKQQPDWPLWEDQYPPAMLRSLLGRQ
jgi:hypothetical protein